MSLSFTNSTGNLFNRLGVIFAGIRDANAYLGTGDLSSGGLRSVGVRSTNTDAQFASADQDLVSGGQNVGGVSLYSSRDQVRTSLDGWKNYLAQLAQAVVIQMVDDDTYIPGLTLKNALVEVLKQMLGSGTLTNADNDVDANTVSISATAFTANVGTGTVIGSVKRPDGRDNEHVLAETIIAECTDDQGTGATINQEPFSLTGEPAASGELAFDWPKGSSCSAAVNCSDPSQDAQSSGNLLTNSDWETWTTTTNPPDNWAATSSSPTFNTDVIKNTSVVYRGSNSIEFKGTASGKGILQAFNSSGATTTTLKPNTRYALCFYAKDSGAGLLAGAVRADLVDGSEVQQTDDAGNAIQLIAAAASTTTTFALFSATFATPKNLPMTSTGAVNYKLRLSASTSLTAGESIYVDDLQLIEMTELYAGGPCAVIVPGATAFVKGDKFAVAVANDAAGDFQQYFQRAFNMRSLGLQLYSDTGAAETIADSLVT